MLAYLPFNSEVDGKFRHIKIELKRKGLHPTAKRGYWAVPLSDF